MKSNQTLDRMTRSAIARLFDCERAVRAPCHRSALLVEFLKMLRGQKILLYSAMLMLGLGCQSDRGLVARGRVELHFAASHAKGPPDGFIIIVPLHHGDIYEPDLENSWYVNEQGVRTHGLNVISENYDEFKFFGYDTRHFISAVPRPYNDIGHFFSIGKHKVKFSYKLNGVRHSITKTCRVKDLGSELR